MSVTDENLTRAALYDENKALRERLEARQRHLVDTDAALCDAQAAAREARRQVEDYHAEALRLSLRVAQLEQACPECRTLMPVLLRTEALCDRRVQVITQLEAALADAKERAAIAERALAAARCRPAWWRRLTGGV